MLVQVKMRQAPGFTLIELMMGIAIMSIALALAVPSYKAWIHNARIRNTAESMLNGLQLARAEAVARNTSVEFFMSSATGTAWTVRCPLPIVTVCPDAVIQARSQNEGSSDDVIVTPNPVDPLMPVVFNNLGRMTSPVPGGGAAFIAMNVDISTSILSAAESRDFRIQVYTSGTVRMCDPNVPLAATGDSRGC